MTSFRAFRRNGIRRDGLTFSAARRDGDEFGVNPAVVQRDSKPWGVCVEVQSSFLGRVTAVTNLIMLERWAYLVAWSS